MAFCFQRNVHSQRNLNKSTQTLDDIYLVFDHCDQNMCFLCVWFNFSENFAEKHRRSLSNAHLWIFDVTRKRKTRNLSLFAWLYQLQRCNLLRRRIPRIETCRVRIQVWFLVETPKRISDWCRKTVVNFNSLICLDPHRVFRWSRRSQSKSRAVSESSWQIFMLRIWVKRLFCARFDKSRRFFPAKNTFEGFNSW